MLGGSGYNPPTPKKIDKNGAIWCILLVPEYVVINQKINIFFRKINHQQPIFCAILFPKVNPDAHVSTKINALIIYKGVGALTTRSQINLKKMEAFPFFALNINTRCEGSHVIMWGLGACSPAFFLFWRILSVPKHVNINLKVNNFKDSKNIGHIFTISMLAARK